MLRAIFWVLKVSVFAAIVLALGNWVQWRGKTVSDQVRTKISHAEQWTGEVTEEAKDWVEKAKENIPKLSEAAATKPKAKEDQREQIDPSERQKLRALIRELNGTKPAPPEPARAKK